MTKEDQQRLAEAFRRMHQERKLFLLPNAWDAMSARVFEASGFDAVGTTSGGIAWALGFPDGERAPWSEVVAATERIVRAVRVPVSADIEGGYGDTPEQVAINVGDIIRAGVAGINLEDSTARPDMPVRPFEDGVARIHAVRDAARTADVPIVINARIDLYQKHIGDAETCFVQTVRRAKAYMAAGADCVFPFGLTDMAVVADLVKALDAPINIVGRAGTDIAQLERLGVTRVSTASGPSLVIMSAIKRVADELRAGDLNGLESTLKRVDAQKLFAARPR
jgi:2-methylisocitrate lyase-like PEP mutase family enzyme